MQSLELRLKEALERRLAQLQPSLNYQKAEALAVHLYSSSSGPERSCFCSRISRMSGLSADTEVSIICQNHSSSSHSLISLKHKRGIHPPICLFFRQALHRNLGSEESEPPTLMLDPVAGAKCAHLCYLSACNVIKSALWQIMLARSTNLPESPHVRTSNSTMRPAA